MPIHVDDYIRDHDTASQKKVVLHDYQQAVSYFIEFHAKCGVFLGMGAGKTLITLETLKRVKPTGHVLVAAPLNIVRSTWLDEVDKWGYNVRTRSLAADDNGKPLSKKERESRIKEVLDPVTPPTMWFINRDNLAKLIDAMPTERIDTGTRTPSGRRRYMVRPLWPFPTVILDESQGFKNPSSVKFKKLCRVQPQITRLIELTGTPTPRSLEDIWSQVYLIDRGAALGPTLSSFRERWMHPTRWVDGRAVGYEPNPGAEDAVYALIADKVVSVKNASIKLPAITINDVLVHMDDDETEMYETLKRDFILEFANDAGDVTEITAANTAVLRARLLQLASGTVYVQDGTGTRIDATHSYRVIHRRKLEMTRNIIENTDSPVLLTYWTRADKNELLSGLDDLGVRHFDGTRDMVRTWNEGRIPVMMIHPASAGHGLNLQDGPGHTMLWYALPDSLEHYEQANARLARPGQANPVTIHRLMTANTYDRLQPYRLDEKHASMQRLLDYVEMDVKATLAEARGAS